MLGNLVVFHFNLSLLLCEGVNDDRENERVRESERESERERERVCERESV